MTEEERQPKKEQEMIPINFKLPRNLYKAALGISLLLGDDSFEDYLHKLVQQDVQMELESGGGC